MATWQSRLTKKLLRHVEQTTEDKTLRGIKANIKHQIANHDYCWQCREIADRLGINYKFNDTLGEKLL